MAFLCPVRMRRDKKKGTHVATTKKRASTKDLNNKLVFHSHKFQYRARSCPRGHGTYNRLIQH